MPRLAIKFFRRQSNDELDVTEFLVFLAEGLPEEFTLPFLHVLSSFANSEFTALFVFEFLRGSAKRIANWNSLFDRLAHISFELSPEGDEQFAANISQETFDLSAVFLRLLRNCARNSPHGPLSRSPRPLSQLIAFSAHRALRRAAVGRV